MGSEGWLESPVFQYFGGVGEDLDAGSNLFLLIYWKTGEKKMITSPISLVLSRMWTEWPAKRHDIAAPTPPRPAPTTIIFTLVSTEAMFWALL